MGSIGTAIVSRHLTSEQGRSIRDIHVIAISFSSHDAEVVAQVRCYVSRNGEAGLVGEVYQIAFGVIYLETNGSCSIYIICGDALAVGGVVVISIGGIFVHEVGILAHVSIAYASGLLIFVVCAVLLSGFAFQGAVLQHG